MKSLIHFLDLFYCIFSDFFSSFALFVIDDDPETIKEAMDSMDGKLYKKAMVEEMTSLDKNEA